VEWDNGLKLYFSGGACIEEWFYLVVAGMSANTGRGFFQILLRRRHNGER
jgi:hypothetical protein